VQLVHDEKMKTPSSPEVLSNQTTRLAYSPRNFAALFGKHYTWAYRQLYKGNIKAITQFGRIMIPKSEADRLLGTAKEYDAIT